MGHRRLLVCFLCMCVAIALFAMFFPFERKHRITREGYAQLKLGMSLEEVEKALGVPAGDYGPGKGEILDYGGFTIASHIIRTDPNGKKWLAGDFAITVCFDKNGRVNGMGTDCVYRPYSSVTEMVWQKLGLKQKQPYPAGSMNALGELFKDFKSDE